MNQKDRQATADSCDMGTRKGVKTGPCTLLGFQVRKNKNRAGEKRGRERAGASRKSEPKSMDHP